MFKFLYLQSPILFALLDQVKLENLLFLDIETVAGVRNFDDLNPQLSALWLDRLTKTTPETGDLDQAWTEKAGLQAEFGKIICISVAYLVQNQDQMALRIKSVAGDHETEILSRFLEMAAGFVSRHRAFQFTGHHVREFDIPYICRRCLILGVPLPTFLQFHGLKPWEVPVLDTLQLWRFGDGRHFVSLNLMACVLGIETPKDDISGSQVGRVYWEDHDLDRISAYCRKDVVAVVQILLRMKGLKLLEPEDIRVIP